MEGHGSESYFVIGEGLLEETLGGRPRTLLTAVEAAVPQFRFSRMRTDDRVSCLPRELQAKVQLSLTSLGDELKRELQPAWGDFFHHELAATKALSARLRRPVGAQALWRDLLADVWAAPASSSAGRACCSWASSRSPEPGPRVGLAPAEFARKDNFSDCEEMLRSRRRARGRSPGSSSPTP